MDEKFVGLFAGHQGGRGVDFDVDPTVGAFPYKVGKFCSSCSPRQFRTHNNTHLVLIFVIRCSENRCRNSQNQPGRPMRTTVSALTYNLLVLINILLQLKTQEIVKYSLDRVNR